MKMLYQPLSIFGIQSAPVEVEVLELGEARSQIRVPLSENCIINIARKRYGHAPLESLEREVSTTQLSAMEDV